MEKKLPQNIQDLVCDVGESQILLRLALLSHQCRDWEVFKNIGESGFDILLVNKTKSKRTAIEAKSRASKGDVHKFISFLLPATGR
jgi:hypothetical protein